MLRWKEERSPKVNEYRMKIMRPTRDPLGEALDRPQTIAPQSIDT